MLENSMINILDEILDERFFQRMCLEQVELPELRRFVAKEQLLKINNQIEQKLGEWELYGLKDTKDFIELGKTKAINTVLKVALLTNSEGYISTIDACNIALNGEENCDIIVGKATEDELQVYVYKLMKQAEDKKSNQIKSNRIE